MWLVHRILNLSCLFSFRLYTLLNILIRGLKRETHIYAVSHGRNMKLDVYRPKQTRELAPVILFVHGGGWAIGTRRIIEPAFVRQIQRGYGLVSITYSLSDKASWPAQMYEVKAAIRWLRANAVKLGFDPDRIIAAGGSAGAHLACVAALSGPGKLEGELGDMGVSSDVKAVVALYPPTDLSGIHKKGWLGKRSVEALLGGPPKLKHKALVEATPATYIRADSPPIRVLHGTIDHVVPYSHAPALVDAIRTAGGPAELITLEGVAHADWRFNSGKPLAAIEAFLDQVSAK